MSQNEDDSLLDQEDEPRLRYYMYDAIDYVRTQVNDFIVSQKHFLTAFIGIHYMYIISLSLIGSFILYPIKNMSYTDALFLSVSASTQTGLNTVPLNDLATYQQVTLFFLPLLAHPLVINSAMVVQRLRYFERKFENIGEMSKRQSKMRRAATMARANARTTSRARPHFEKPDDLVEDAISTSTSSSAPAHAAPPPADRDIRFGALPTPHHNTQDMFRSLNMMQNRPNHPDMDEEDGPALVIKSPRDVEMDEARGISGVVRTPTVPSPTAQPAVTTSDEAIHAYRSASPVRRRESTASRLRRADTSMSTRSGRSMRSNRSNRRNMRANYLSYAPTVGGNSTFVGLTHEQKDELGGVEHRALKLLLWIVGLYYFGFLLLSFVLFIPWTYARSHYRDIAYSEGYKPVWYSFFIGMSNFANLGMSLSPDSYTIYQKSAYFPLLSTILVVAGNTGLPVFLRIMIWLAFKLTPPYGRMHETLAFLLDHPRRCFMLLFPRGTTAWLLFTLVSFNLIDLILFVILDLDRPDLQVIPRGYRVMCGFFQSICTRTAGFSILSINDLHIAVRLSYIVMMYVSVFPVAMSIRNTNVYEEQTLASFDETDDGASENASNAPHRHHSRPLISHMQRQLSHDLWYMVLGLFVVCLAEAGRIQRNDIPFFDCLFEVVSAYATVGLSVGYPGTSPSLAGQFTVIGRLILMALMIRGRHRGLPYRIDRSIMLKGDEFGARDDLQQQIARNPTVMQANDDTNRNWFTRVNTTASRLKRVGTTATVGLRPAFTMMSTRTKQRPRAMST